MMATKDWEAADPATAAGRLTRREESEIRGTLRPIKSDKQQTRESEKLALGADETIRPEDRRIPPQQLHDWDLDAQGIVDWTEDFYRYLSGKSPHAGVVRKRVSWIIRELDKHPRKIFRGAAPALELCLLHGSTQEMAARELVTYQVKISRWLKVGIPYVQERYRMLYHEEMLIRQDIP